jgi:RNA polymerase sigma-70 factor (ECF subfamily)
MFSDARPRLIYAVFHSKTIQPEPSCTTSGEEVVERTLIANAKRGDATAFEALLTRHQSLVLRVATRLLVNSDDARDAAQEVFLRLYKYLHRFDETRPLSPWLYQMTVNVCRDLTRKRPAVPNLSLESDDAERAFRIAGTQSTPEQEFHAAEERALLERALASLGDKERAAVVLRDIEGLDTKEVAKLLGSSETTVRSQISVARVKLKKFRDAVLKGGNCA